MRLVAIFSCFLFGCEPDYLENGRILLGNGAHLEPREYPIFLSAHHTFSEMELYYAAIWWNSETDLPLFEVTDVAEGSTPVSIGYTEESDGLYKFRANRYGKIISGEIIVSYDIAYDGDVVFEILLHEMGHSLGLDDDPRSLDLNSIMSSPLIFGSKPTSFDKYLIRESYDATLR